MAELAPVLADLSAESKDLEAMVSVLPDAGWATPTPSPGWTIAHQIAHLAWTDDAAVLAVTDPDRFQADLQRALVSADSMVDTAAAQGAAQPPGVLLDTWRNGRAELAGALLAADGSRITWFGPPMSATSMATARLMETWAHGQDVADALGVTRLPTPRLRHVAHLGVRTRDFAFLVRDRQPPPEPVRVELAGPDGTIWIWGDADAGQAVTGPALDFCLLVTRRRHRDDLSLVAVGDVANEWLDIAQAFAGPPGEGRAAGEFSA
jgi:uncharacterized protein (TIGR03084 family)